MNLAQENIFADFYQVPNLKFDISRLRSDLELVLKRRQFNSPGITHFGAIPVNQIPNDLSLIHISEPTRH